MDGIQPQTCRCSSACRVEPKALRILQTVTSKFTRGSYGIDGIRCGNVRWIFREVRILAAPPEPTESVNRTPSCLSLHAPIQHPDHSSRDSNPIPSEFSRESDRSGPSSWMPTPRWNFDRPRQIPDRHSVPDSGHVLFDRSVALLCFDSIGWRWGVFRLGGLPAPIHLGAARYHPPGNGSRCRIPRTHHLGDRVLLYDRPAGRGAIRAFDLCQTNQPSPSLTAGSISTRQGLRGAR